MSKIIAAILIFLVLWLQYRVWYSDNGMKQLALLNDKIERQSKENALLHQQNLVLKNEIELLRNSPKVLEEKAREKLGLIKKGEVFYRIIPEQTK
jgi:cell division protein FtsB